MSATVVPFRPRRNAPRPVVRPEEAPYLLAPAAPRATPIRIDGSVSLYQLLTGLHSVGLSFRREPGTGVYVISSKPWPQPPL